MTLSHSELYSTYAGCASAGYALSGFLPSIFFNMWNRRVDLDHESLWSFALGALLSIVGLILVDGSDTQFAMSGLHELCVIILFIQLQYYGYDASQPENPLEKPPAVHWYTRLFVPRIRNDARESETIRKRNPSSWHIKLLNRLASWNSFKKLKLIIGVQVVAFVVWYTLYVIRASDPDFTLEVSTAINPAGMAFGGISIVILLLGRFVELRHHRKNYHAWKEAIDTFEVEEDGDDFESDSDTEDEKDPSDSLSMKVDDPLDQKPTLNPIKIVFWSLMVENVAQLISIVALSQHPNYIVSQLPWLLLAALPILLDCYSVAFGVWWKWKMRKAKKERVVTAVPIAAISTRGTSAPPVELTLQKRKRSQKSKRSQV